MTEIAYDPSFKPFMPGRRRWTCVLLAILALLITPPEVSGQAQVETVTSFDAPFSFGGYNKPSFPVSAMRESALIQAADGNFYSTTREGFGVVSRIDRDGTRTIVHRFSITDGRYPTGLMQAADGNFYGATAEGGAHDLGTIFMMDLAGHVRTLHDFQGSDGASPEAGVIQGSDGSFYGTTRVGGQFDAGTVFRLTADGALTTLHSFAGVDGAQPAATLTEGSDGRLYGTTSFGGPRFAGPSGPQGDGTVFAIDPSGTFSMLHGFGTSSGEGWYPIGGLVASVDGGLYGVTSRGGTIGGTVFRVDPAGAFTVVRDFSHDADGYSPPTGLTRGSDGLIYGLTSTSYLPQAVGFGSLFRIDATGTSHTLHRFTDTGGILTRIVQGAEGTLYGTGTLRVGTSHPTAFFRLDADGALTALQRFDDTATDGAFPIAGLTETASGLLYGTTTVGGLAGGGMVFSIDETGRRTTLALPQNGSAGALLQANDGNLYGTTFVGGNIESAGTVFRIDASNSPTTLRTFLFGQGSPRAGLIQAADGNLYGTAHGTFAGSSMGPGTVFLVDPRQPTTPFYAQVRHEFNGSDGRWPLAGLLQGADGTFYGTTSEGGAFEKGTVFAMATTGAVTTLHSFIGADGALPRARLVQGRDGRFYSTTEAGGEFGNGTLFVIDGAHHFSTVHSFAGDDGANPYAGLLEGSEGRFYGTTRNGGAFGLGTVFVLDPTGAVATLHSFTYAEGAYPSGDLIQARDGYFYGTTEWGGPGGGGVVYRLRIEPPNRAPVAAPDRYEGSADALLTVEAPGVLGNDVDEDGDTLTATLVVGAAHGNLSLQPDGSFTYRPFAGFTGTDVFTYSASDGRVTSELVPVSLVVTRAAATGRLTLSRRALRFHPQPVETTSAPQSIIVWNSDNTGTVTVTGVTTTGDFQQTNSCGRPLGPAQRCVIRVTFTPTRLGVRTGKLTVDSTARGRSQHVSLKGEGKKRVRHYPRSSQ
ncbi:MAG: choice-of-anchor D domain-containing protein [Luteitalea sp.]|nr:choice-of-anchor D domain-containing protein [Luteitalea sp.]